MNLDRYDDGSVGNFAAGPLVEFSILFDLMAVPTKSLNYLGPAELEDVVLVDCERPAGGVDVGEGRLGLLAGLDEGDLPSGAAVSAGRHLVADVPDVGLGGDQVLLLLGERLDLSGPDGNNLR